MSVTAKATILIGWELPQEEAHLLTAQKRLNKSLDKVVPDNSKYYYAGIRVSDIDITPYTTPRVVPVLTENQSKALDDLAKHLGLTDPPTMFHIGRVF